MYYTQLFRTKTVAYDREKAVEYAHKWAFSRNNKYLDFEKYGGDCTNFASQVIYAGSGVMNSTKIYGWHYYSSNNRTASWTGVDFLHNFLINNKSLGPQGEVVDVKDIKPGDIIQLCFDGGTRFHHSPVVVEVGSPAKLENILVACHTIDRDNYPVTNYIYEKIRCIHIKEVKK